MEWYTWDALGSHIPNGDEVQYSLGVSVNEKIDEVEARVDDVETDILDRVKISKFPE